MVCVRRAYNACITRIFAMPSKRLAKQCSAISLMTFIACALYGCGHKGPLIAPERANIEATFQLPEATDSEQ